MRTLLPVLCALCLALAGIAGPCLAAGTGTGIRTILPSDVSDAGAELATQISFEDLIADAQRYQQQRVVILGMLDGVSSDGAWLYDSAGSRIFVQIAFGALEAHLGLPVAVAGVVVIREGRVRVIATSVRAERP
jgi:hypothetical protein